MRLYALLFLLTLSVGSYARKSNTDSIALAIDYFKATLNHDFESFSDRKTRKIIRSRCKAFKLETGIYLPMLTLSNNTFLASPPTLIMTPLDSTAYEKLKSKEARELYLIRKCLDDPEISLENFKALLKVYYAEYGKWAHFDATWINKDTPSFSAFKLMCYHLLSAYFPNNASFKFIIGRWHYNRGIDLLNGIGENESEKNKTEIQEESQLEIKMALPWFKEAARLYEPFKMIYKTILLDLGIEN